MGCLGQPPASVDAWLAIVDRCAAEAGGPNWQAQALLGLQAVVLLVFAVLLAAALLARARANN